MALIDVPVQIVVGEEDSVIGADVLRRELIPHLTCTAAQLTMIPGAGHLVPLEAPSAVAPAIEQYVP